MNPALTVVGDQLWKRIGESMDRVELRLRKAYLFSSLPRFRSRSLVEMQCEFGWLKSILERCVLRTMSIS